MRLDLIADGGARRDVLTVDECLAGEAASSPVHTRHGTARTPGEVNETMPASPDRQHSGTSSPTRDETRHGEPRNPGFPAAKVSTIKENIENPKAVMEKESNKKWSTSDEESDDSSCTIHHFIITTVTEKRLLEKLVFTLSVSTLVFMTYGVLAVHWLLPYYYAIATPILIAIRVVMYWKNKWQYFLIDFCYFANLLCYVYLWAAPSHPYLFTVMFAFANGPLAWAVLLFRNSLVFHSTDKVTSVYIHVLPVFLMYSIRWFSTSISHHWYTPFISTFDESIPFMAVWLFAVPLAGFVFHIVFYTLLVHVILRPKEEYMNTYRYFTSDGTILNKPLSIFGAKYKLIVFQTGTVFYSVVSLLFVMVCYKYFMVHTIFMTLVCLLTVWNGSSFYMDVFSVKGFREDS